MTLAAASVTASVTPPPLQALRADVVQWLQSRQQSIFPQPIRLVNFPKERRIGGNAGAGAHVSDNDDSSFIESPKGVFLSSNLSLVVDESLTALETVMLSAIKSRQSVNIPLV